MFSGQTKDDKSVASMDSEPYTNGSNDLFTNQKIVKNCRDIALKHIYESSSVGKGGLQECIENALGFHPESDSTTTTKESFQFGEERNKYPAMTHSMLNGTQNNTELCKRVFSDILRSEKFTALCDLILQNFNGVKVDSIFDFSKIDSRMKQGAYECSPGLFHSDLLQMWTKLENVGTELVTLAKSLSGISRTYGGQQYPTLESAAYLNPEFLPEAAKKSVVEGIQADKELNTSSGSNETGLQQLGANNFPQCNICRHEVKNHESSTICGNFGCPRKYYHTTCLTSKQLESYGPCWYCPSCLCQTCFSDQDDDKIILCDSCDQGFHIYCTRPPLSSIPEGKWLCTKCMHKARRAYLRKQKKFTKKTKEQKEAQRENQFEESSSGLRQLVVGKMNLQCCHICHQEVENLEDLKICSNFLCPRKYYHNRCLTIEQLESYGPCWYCPSCLCQVCFSDKDDDKVILCDICDHGYHIYCTQPPLGSIPEGKWSCHKCVEASLSVRKSRRRFQRTQMAIVEIENVARNASERSEEVVSDSGGVDLLLAAAKTVNLEESLAALAMDS